MDCLEQAKTLYSKQHGQGRALSRDEQASMATTISKLIRSCLLQQGGSASFRYIPFLHVIQRTVNANSFRGDKAAMAFLTLEKYLLLLAQQPWKREFWVLKIYGGYFCSKVRAHLEGAEEILKLIGFVPDEGATDSQCLVLHEAPDTQVALNVAFDCQVASLECQYIEDYHAKMKCVGLDLSDAMNVLLSGASSDPLVGSSMLGLLGKPGGVGDSQYHIYSNISNINNNFSNALPPSVDVGGQGAGRSRTVLASGGMGMGVVTGVKATHQVIGVQPSHHASVGSSIHQVIGVSPTHHATSASSLNLTRASSLPAAGAASFPLSGGHRYAGAGQPAVKVAGMPTGAGSSGQHVTGLGTHQVTGVMATHAPSCASRPMDRMSPVPGSVYIPAQQVESPYVLHSEVTPQLGLGLTTHLPPHHTSLQLQQSSGRAPSVASHPQSVISYPPSIASHPPGSRGSYASSADASSSAYGSGSASVLSGGSSAYTGSSGYSSALSSSSNHDYANLPLIRPGDPTDHTAVPSRPPRQSHKPQFSYIQEDEAYMGAPFPEATHEEHMRESLRNLQASHVDKAQHRPLAKNISSQLVSRPDDPVLGVGSEAVGMGVTYDDWRWFRDGMDKGAPLSGGRTANEGRGSKSQAVPSGVIQRPAPPSAAMTRGHHSQPATAVTSMLSADAMETKLPYQPVSADPVPHRPQTQGYVPWTSASVSLSSPMMPQYPQDAGSHRTGVMSPHHVYYPPACSDASYKLSNITTGSPSPSQPSSALTQKAASSKREVRSPLISRVQEPIYNNLDNAPTHKVLNVRRDNSGASSEAAKRDGGAGRVGVKGRVSSLGATTPATGHSAVTPPLAHSNMGGGVGGWRCSSCTMENREEERVCAVCGRSRGASDLLFPLTGESKRVCPSCTFENPPGCTCCEVCQSLLSQDVHTYV